MKIDFVYIGEGPSDEGLIPHLEMLCLEAGAEEVTGIAPDFRRLPDSIGHSVADKIRAAMRLEPNANLFFIHRDSDSIDPSPRYSEIAEAVETCELQAICVSVIPVQETEAWLLLDEMAIRLVAGNPNGRVQLNLPAPDSVETIARPKVLLKEVLITASGKTGRRLSRFRHDFPIHRRLLLQKLSSQGRVTRLQAWSRMQDDIKDALNSIQANESKAL